jgi:hypothetical protein
VRRIPRLLVAPLPEQDPHDLRVTEWHPAVTSIAARLFVGVLARMRQGACPPLIPGAGGLGVHLQQPIAVDFGMIGELGPRDRDRVRGAADAPVLVGQE